MLLDEPFLLLNATACSVGAGPHHPGWEDAVFLDRTGQHLSLRQLNTVAWTSLSARRFGLDQPRFSDFTSI